MHPVKRIYLRLPNWIGDVCMSLPSLQLACATGVPVVACARPWARDLLAALPLAGFVPMSGKLMQDRAAVKADLQQHKLSGKTGARGLLLPDSLSSAAVFALSGLRSAGYRDDGRSILLSWPISKPEPRPHAVESWYGLTRQALLAWGLSADAERPRDTLGLPLTQTHHEHAEAACQAYGLMPGQFVLIAPTATGLHRGKVKVWPEFDAYTRALQQQGITVAMCPPPAEADDARRNAPTATLMAPLSLGAFAALTRRAGLVVCNDSGVSHIAAAAGAHQLTLFGVTQRERTGPWSPLASCLGQDGHWPAANDVLARTHELLASPIGSA